MIIDDGGLGVGCKRELADLHLASGFFGFGLRESNAADLRLTIGAAGNVVLVHRFGRFSGNARHRHNALHGAGMRQLRQAGNNVTDGVDALLAGLHPLIGMDKAALHLDIRRLLKANAFRVWSASHGHQHFLGFQLLRGFALGRKAYGYAILCLLHLLYLGIDEAVDALLLE
jgi:hypothetical protein